jgi:hypothetical protein
MFNEVQLNEEKPLKKKRANKQHMFQKKVVEDDTIDDFFYRISKLENCIFNEISEFIDGDQSFVESESVAIMIKYCNALLDIRKKQLEIRIITNFQQ